MQAGGIEQVPRLHTDPSRAAQAILVRFMPSVAVGVAVFSGLRIIQVTSLLAWIPTVPTILRVPVIVHAVMVSRAHVIEVTKHWPMEVVQFLAVWCS